MKLYGSTKVYGIVLEDLKENKTYNITGTIRDLYQTYTESGSEVRILLPTKLMGKECLAEVVSISKSEYDGLVYQVKDIFSGISEELAGLDSSIYLSGDTIICPPGKTPSKVGMLMSDVSIQVTKFEVENPDFYELELKYKDDTYKVTNLVINSVMILTKKSVS